jgi:hypothetical protein
MPQIPLDPEIRRWNRNYRTFPSVPECVELLRRRNLSGVWVDLILDGLIERAPTCLDELIDCFHKETESGIQKLLLSVIAEAHLEQAHPFLQSLLHSEDAELSRWAVYGLQ